MSKLKYRTEGTYILLHSPKHPFRNNQNKVYEILYVRFRTKN